MEAIFEMVLGAIFEMIIVPLASMIGYALLVALAYVIYLPLVCLVFTPLVLVCAYFGPGAYGDKVVSGYKGVVTGCFTYGGTGPW